MAHGLATVKHHGELWHCPACGRPLANANNEVAGWLREAYAVGEQKHLES